MRLPMPGTDDLWVAPTAAEWKARYLWQPEPRYAGIECLSDCVRDLMTERKILPYDQLSGSALFVLHGTWSVIWGYRRTQDLISIAGYPPELWPGLLPGREGFVKMLTKIRVGIENMAEAYPTTRSLEATMLVEYLSMVLHVPLYYLQVFAGKDGAAEARRVYPLLQEWSLTKESRQSMWHAGQLFKAARDLPAELMRNSRVVIVYQTSLTFWAYGVISSARKRRDRILTPQLAAASITRGGPLVGLDGPLNPSVRSFIALDEGTPCIRESSDLILRDDTNDSGVKSLQCPSKTMGVAIRILRRPEESRDVSCTAFTESITRLMSEIGKAAQAIGLG